jgi:hypothetical protein
MHVANSVHLFDNYVMNNMWEICLRMRYNLRGLRERDLGRVNMVI